jgi:hypothetical protein
MLTSGLQTLWSQYLISGLSALQQAYCLGLPFTLDTWKGTSSMRPCFAAVRQQGQKMIDLDLTEQLKDAKADRDTERSLKIMRDAIEIINAAVSGYDIESVAVAEEKPLPADIDF